MDDPNVDQAELAASLSYIRTVNRQHGGASALLNHLKRWSVNWPKDRPVKLLDIATGSADLPLAARAWAAQAGFDLQVTAVDLHEKTLELAREHLASQPDLAAGIELVRADARDLTERFSPGSFDYTHAGLFLHHLPEIEILTVLRIMERLACRGIVWNDLVRSRTALCAVTVLTKGKPHIIKHDATVSVRAAFTKREVLEYARRLDLSYCKYSASFFTQRFTLAGEKPRAWS